jgi:hypothetical protein
MRNVVKHGWKITQQFDHEDLPQQNPQNIHGLRTGSEDIFEFRG